MKHTSIPSHSRFYVIAGAICLALFIILTYFVARENLDQFDFDITVRLQDNIPTRFDDEFSAMSLIGSFEVTTMVFIILSYLAGSGWVKRAIVFLSFPVFHVIEIMGKTLIDKHPPPFLFHRYVFDFHFPSSYLATDHFSYPSGHVGRTAMIMTLGLLLVWHNIKNRYYRIVFSGVLVSIWGLMFVSRIVLAEHWASDVIGGTLLGISMVLFARAAA